MEYFTRYFVRDADGETQEVYDGEDERGNAMAAVELYPGGYVESLQYSSDRAYQRETDERCGHERMMTHDCVECGRIL